MKKFLSLAILASTLGAGYVQAQTDIYIDGSTAFRKSVYNEMKLLYGANLTAEAGVTNDAGGNYVWAPVNNGNSTWIMTGQMTSLFGGSRIITVHAAFTGSVQGIHSLYANTDTQNYLTNTTAVLGSAAPFQAHTATLCFSDVDSSSTPYNLATLTGGATELHVAVQPFAWVKSVLCPNTFTNITSQQIQALLANGQVAMQILSGNTNDTFNVTMVNRSKDSGTRVTAFADALYVGGAQNYYWSTTNNNWYASNTPLPGAPSLYGAGYVGGGDVANAIKYTGAANSNNIAVAYLGVSDANGVNSGANVLNYNGATPSTAIKPGNSFSTTSLVFDNTANGTYSFWAYECLDFPNTVTASGQNITATELTSFARTVAGYDADLTTFNPGSFSIDHDIAIQSGKTAVRLGDMHCSRQSVGSVITPN